MNPQNTELTIESVKRKTVKGIAFLAGRTFFLQIVSLFSVFLLTIFLSPNQFGTFFIVSAVINFFSYFSDVGLAAALIQKKEAPSSEELKTTFTIQQILVVTLIILIFTATPLFKSWYNLSQEAINLLWVLAFSLLFSSLKSIPSVLLERKLEFSKLVVPQIVESLIFNGITVYLAWQGFGVTSFTIAVAMRSIAGLLLIYILQPWLPGIAFAKKPLQGLFRFGIPYQANTFLASLKDDGLTAFLGVILGPSGMGLLGWAQKWGQAPLRFFMDPVIKVTFPAFSRMQHNKEELSNAVSRSIFFICLFVFPTTFGLISLASSLVEVIPKYEKWQGALLALSLITVNTFWAAITTPLTNLLNSIGKIGITFRLMIMWTSLTWLLIPILSLYFGVNGAASGFALIGFSSIVAIVIATKFVRIDFIKVTVRPFVASLFMGLSIVILSELLAPSLFSILIMVVLGILIYLGLILLLVGKGIFKDLKLIIEALGIKRW